MPKKTKKEKLIAQYRRKLAATKTTGEKKVFTHPVAARPAQSPAVATPSLYQFRSASNHPRPSAVIRIETTQFTAIRRDIVKTLVLSASAVAVEFIVFVILR